MKAVKTMTSCFSCLKKLANKTNDRQPAVDQNIAGIFMMKMFTNILLVAALGGFSSAAMAEGVVTGPPTVVNATTMIIAGKTVKLAHITSTMPGDKCTIRHRNLDCGVLSAAGLKDLTAGAVVSCVKAAQANGYVCRSGGFDLAYGLIHAGWAVPTKSAPKYYFAKQERARKRKLMLWAAKDKDGRVIAANMAINLSTN